MKIDIGTFHTLQGTITGRVSGKDPHKSNRPKVGSLKSGDEADMWHEGTQQYYRVKVEKPLTVEEAMGPY